MSINSCYRCGGLYSNIGEMFAGTPCRCGAPHDLITVAGEQHKQQDARIALLEAAKLELERRSEIIAQHAEIEKNYRSQIFGLKGNIERQREHVAELQDKLISRNDEIAGLRQDRDAAKLEAEMLRVELKSWHDAARRIGDTLIKTDDPMTQAYGNTILELLRAAARPNVAAAEKERE